MKLLALLIGSAAAFAPSTINNRASTSLNMERREVISAVATAAASAAFVAPALADGAVSAATVSRAKGIYGQRIAALKAAVDKGDFAAVAEEKNAFILYNSGVYPGAKNKAKLAAAIEGTNKIFGAIRAKDAAALKSAYGAYVSLNEIEAYKALDQMGGQGYSSDYDWKRATPVGTIYVR